MFLCDSAFTSYEYIPGGGIHFLYLNPDRWYWAFVSTKLATSLPVVLDFKLWEQWPELYSPQCLGEDDSLSKQQGPA